MMASNQPHFTYIPAADLLKLRNPCVAVVDVPFCYDVEMSKGFEFCRICRRNHNQGRGHQYSVKHKQNLDRILKKLLERIERVRHFVKNAVPVTAKDQMPRDCSGKIWCHICEEETLNDQSSHFVCAQAIKHFASQKHAENVKRFWAENGGVIQEQHMYIIETTDLARWEEACSKVVPTSVGVHGPLLNKVNKISQSDEHHVSVAPVSKERALQSSILSPTAGSLAVIQVPSVKPVEGNVHSGAVPPWLKQSSGEGGNTATSSTFPLLPPLLSRTQERKFLKMRNPNRVGAAWAERRRAELEREQRGETVTRSVKDDSSWFPSFGRVWQSGSRRETRKEFEAEKHSEVGKQGRRARGLAKKMSRSVQLKPYISRQQRMAMEVTPK